MTERISKLHLRRLRVSEWDEKNRARLCQSTQSHPIKYSEKSASDVKEIRSRMWEKTELHDRRKRNDNRLIVVLCCSKNSAKERSDASALL
jgi:hypothetical protein